jgi:acyl-coenzyme A thioesterase PaaI-like protein
MSETTPGPEVLDPHLFFGHESRCFGCCPDHPTGLRLPFEKHGDVVRTRFFPKAGAHEGAPGILHGGLALTMADELAAWVLVGLVGRFGFTVGVDARLARALKTEDEITGEGWLASPFGRIVRVEVSLVQGGEQAFRGTFTFAMLEQGATEKLLGRPLPESWVKYTRSGE